MQLCNVSYSVIKSKQYTGYLNEICTRLHTNRPPP